MKSYKRMFLLLFSCSHIQLFATPWTVGCQAPLFFTVSRVGSNSWLLSNHLILCFPLLLLTSLFPNIRVFFNELALHIRWPKYQSFSFNNSPSNEYSGFISLTFDQIDLLAVQRTLQSLLKHHSPKTPVLLCSAFFIVQLSHPYMSTGGKPQP